MGFLRRLFGGGTPALPREVLALTPGGRVYVVGEASYQPAIESIAGPPTASRQSHGMRVEAILEPEPRNPVDRRAIVVKVAGRTVGYLSRADRDTWEQQVLGAWQQGRVAGCMATISGGWDRGGDDVGLYGVVLDIRDRRSVLLDSVVLTSGELAGMNVCFTGPSACSFGGRPLDRLTQEAVARKAGLIVLPRVTKKLQVLVLADPYVMTGKTVKAEEYGIRVMQELEFWRAVGVPVD